jgi:hypothetical protein
VRRLLSDRFAIEIQQQAGMLWHSGTWERASHSTAQQLPAIEPSSGPGSSSPSKLWRGGWRISLLRSGHQRAPNG